MIFAMSATACSEQFTYEAAISARRTASRTSQLLAEIDAEKEKA